MFLFVKVSEVYARFRIFSQGKVITYKSKSAWSVVYSKFDCREDF